MATPLISLNNGMKMPAFGLGTWQAATGEVGEVVKQAIEAGYRMFDCAWLYSNEKEIGEGLREKINDGSVKREDLFVVTKLWNTFHRENEVVAACKESLKNFGLDYVDCYLIHWPCSQRLTGELNPTLPFANAVDDEYDFTKTWKGMEECVRLGLAKSIGLSNFNSQQVKRIMEKCTIKPVVNQIEVTPFLNQRKLIKFCNDLGIKIMAYSPLASPTRGWLKPGDLVLSFNDPKLLAIGNKYGKTGAQVVLRYVYQQSTIPIPKSSNAQRLKQNIDIFDFELTDEELRTIDQFNCGVRVCSAEDMINNSEYPFNFKE
ncbi:unnamed protein product [Phyllotreta striolata]|uniref:NADP-dependent oxidoreductase domain-containing protein n=1 Tax=Phyllotreta striolata TaxID=444603 RepID=A0A9P0DS30_PHYSR|nr:unnamed protein product [Phyllotreta striolata]